jgi:outer membrane protein assembly factor BamA
LRASGCSPQHFQRLTYGLPLQHDDINPGYGNGYGSTDGLPFYESYTAGGQGWLRGFKDGTLGPRSTPATGTYSSAGQAYYSDRNTDVLGGNILITGGAEYIFPLPFIKNQSQLAARCSSSPATSMPTPATCPPPRAAATST